MVESFEAGAPLVSPAPSDKLASCCITSPSRAVSSCTLLFAASVAARLAAIADDSCKTAQGTQDVSDGGQGCCTRAQETRLPSRATTCGQT